MLPLYVAFYTRDTLYEHEAARLRASLDALGLERDIHAVDDRGSWAANAAITPSFLMDMLDRHAGRPLVYLDADAVVWSHPVLMDALSPADTDIAVHRCKWGELANGTLWLGNTDGCRRLIADYRRRVGLDVNCRNEQVHLDHAIKANPDVRVEYLPAAYCYIHDLMGQLGGEAIIEHLQASRESSGSPMLPSRRKRLADLAPDLEAMRDYSGA